MPAANRGRASNRKSVPRRSGCPCGVRSTIGRKNGRAVAKHANAKEAHRKEYELKNVKAHTITASAGIIKITEGKFSEARIPREWQALQLNVSRERGCPAVLRRTAVRCKSGQPFARRDGSALFHGSVLGGVGRGIHPSPASGFTNCISISPCLSASFRR